MKNIEYFLPRLNGWLSISLDNYLSILFSQENKKLPKIKIPKGLPITTEDQSPPSQEELDLSPGNFVEVLLKQNLILESNNKKGQLQISNVNNNSKEQKLYDVWTRGKIISNDKNSKIIFVELNDKIIIIDKIQTIRPLKKIKTTENVLVAYNLKQISSNEYNLINNEFNKLLSDEINNNKLFYIKYDVINTSLLCLGNKDDLNNLLLLKQYEKKYNKNNSDEQNSISDLSNPNSNNNLIGIGIKSSGGSDNSENKGIILDDEIKNELNEYKYKCYFNYRDYYHYRCVCY